MRAQVCAAARDAHRHGRQLFRTEHSHLYPHLDTGTGRGGSRPGPDAGGGRPMTRFWPVLGPLRQHQHGPATAPAVRGRRTARRGICRRAVAAGSCGVRLAFGRAGLGPGDGRRLRRPTPSTTVVVAQPLPSDALLQIDGKYPVFRRFVRSSDGTALSEDLHAAYKRVFSKIDGATCLRHPMDTRSQGCLTRSDLMRAGPDLPKAGGRNATTSYTATRRLAPCSGKNCASASEHPSKPPQIPEIKGQGSKAALIADCQFRVWGDRR